MKKKDLEYLLEALNYGLNYCIDTNDNAETHFNTFANAVNLVQDELNFLNIHIVMPCGDCSTKTSPCRAINCQYSKVHKTLNNMEVTKPRIIALLPLEWPTLSFAKKKKSLILIKEILKRKNK